VAGIDGLTVATATYEAACKRMAIGHNWRDGSSVRTTTYQIRY
jgi:hypothetical protein